MSTLPIAERVTLPVIIRTWWPLAASWLLMGAEIPVLSAVVARLPNAEVNLAAYGGIVFPLALIIESPIIMLLAASTALSKDWNSYRRLRRFMLAAGATLTLLHILIVFTPAYFLLTRRILGVPEEIIVPGRIGLMILTPWTWSIAYRRFNQGVLIRFGHSRAVGTGTMVRLSADGLILAAGYLIGSIPGIVVAAGAVAAGVVSEAIFVGLVVRPVLKGPLKNASPGDRPLNLRFFLNFYIPLAMTSLLTLLANPIGSAALSRMPEAVASLAVWPVVTGLVFMLRALGVAYNEVVVALLEETGASPPLRRFAANLALVMTTAIILLAVTPLSGIWFGRVSALPPHLVSLARRGLWACVPLPAISVLQSWFQGSLLYGRRTRGVTESVFVYLLTSAFVLGLGVIWQGYPGVYVGLASLSLSTFTQTIWLWYRSRPVLAEIAARDSAGDLSNTPELSETNL